MDIRQTLENEILPFVRRPARYIGGEINAVGQKDAEVRLLLSYPDVYELGMSHLGLRILYDIVNRTPWAKAERTFAVWEDMEKLMRAREVPLYSLETFTPAREFDFWGFSLQAELTYTNILAMLDLARLPLKARDRAWPGMPLILGGGGGGTNPEPLADFFDLFLIGDGEEAILEILSAYRLMLGGKTQIGKAELLARLVKEVPGLYAPGLYRVEYEVSGKFRAIYPRAPGIPSRIRKRVLENLNHSGIERPLIPVTEVVHDRAVVEIMRGCRRGCRFCQASWIGRPVREKKKETVTNQALDLAGKGGFDEVSLLSLSSGDYREIEDLLVELAPRLARRMTGLSLPSLNAASVSDRMFLEIKRVRKSSVTLAPEAGSARLRRVINKNLEPEVLAKIGRYLRRMGWRLLKLYFMLGLPTEREEDIEAVAETINRMSGWGGGLNVTLSTFIPKPGTPFQWSEMVDSERIKGRQALIRRRVRSGKVKLKFRLPELGEVEGILARGDRRVGALLLAAWEEGCRFDDWQECFRYDRWEKAFQRAALKPEFYLKPPYSYEDVLPWSHIDVGVPRRILVKEAKKAWNDH